MTRGRFGAEAMSAPGATAGAVAALLTAWTAALAASTGAALASGGAAGPTGPTVEAAWARASIGGSKVSAVYLTLTNRGAAPLRLVGAETDRAGRTMLHRTIIEGGVAKMRHVPELHVPPGGSVRFEPGGLHVMLTGLPSPLETGDTLALTLLFEGGARLTTPVPVRTTTPPPPTAPQ